MEVIINASPGCESHQGGPDGDPDLVGNLPGVAHIGFGMALLQLFEDGIAERFDCRGDEDASQPGHLADRVLVLHDVFDFGREVEGEVGELLVHPANNAQGVLDTVEEVGIAKVNVAGPHLYQLGDVL